MPLFHLAYISRANSADEKDLRDILAVARERNAELNVTGALVHLSGHYFQVLEGQREALQTLMAAIRADPRHCAIEVLFDQRADHRAFEAWSMALGSELKPQLPGVDYVTLIDDFARQTRLSGPTIDMGRIFARAFIDCFGKQR